MIFNVFVRFLSRRDPEIMSLSVKPGLEQQIRARVHTLKSTSGHVAHVNTSMFGPRSTPDRLTIARSVIKAASQVLCTLSSGFSV